MRRKKLRSVVAFDSTHEALSAESLCHAEGIEGRLIPTPVAIKADCGLAWSMPPEVRPLFEERLSGKVVWAGIYELEL